ncbi:MAG: hypothetical protein N2C14_18520 [Planctomycetales bacterium]
MRDLNHSLRTFTILASLTSLDLVRRLLPLAIRIARLAADFRRGTVTPDATFHFEIELQNLLREVGRFIVQETLQRLEPDDPRHMPTRFLWDGEYYRRRRKSPMRNLNCLFGPIALRRCCYQPLETAGRCLFPLQLQLGVVGGVATPALADKTARLSADLTQRQTLDRLRQHNVRWGPRTLRKVAAAMAERMSEHRHAAQAERLLAWLAEAEAGKGSRQFVLSVGRDGVMIPIVKSQTYKEAAAATVSVMHRSGKRLGTIYLGQTPEAGQTTISEELTRLLREVLSRWKGEAPRLVYVTDAGHHPTVYFEEVLTRMYDPRGTGELLDWEWVVDYYHACQYITKLGQAILGPGREAFTWAAKQRRVLKTKPGGVFRVLRSAGALASIRGLTGSEEVYQTAYHYLHSRATKMDYVNYRRLRMPIGSGVTEAACKIVFTQRFKQSGMKWSVAGAGSILSLRVIALSGLWSRVRRATLQSHVLPQPATPKGFLQETGEIPGKTAA